MKLRSLATWILLGLISATAVVTGTARLRESRAEGSNDSTTNSFRTGSVTFNGSTACPSNAATGATCQSITVSCPDLPGLDLDATLGVASPTGTAKGTIILLNGGPGTKFFNSGFANTYLADGFNVAQLAWVNDWASANGIGVKSAACRPATVFKTIFNSVQRGSRTTGFCGQGISGGGAALAYSLAQYGLGDYFDYVVMAASPAVARMDYGCDTSLYSGPSRNLCPLLPNAPFAYGSGKLEDEWENTTTCTAKNPLPSDIDRWTADSIVSAGANYSYPHTAMSFYFCVTALYATDGNTGQSTFLIDQVVPKNVPPDVNCYSGTCQGESVWEDPNAFSTTVSEMLAQCVPNH